MPFDPEFMNFFSIIGICSAVVGVLLLIVVPKSDTFRWRLGLGLFVAGAFAIVYSFLFLNQDFLESLRDNIALTLIGLVIATISVIKIIRK